MKRLTLLACFALFACDELAFPDVGQFTPDAGDADIAEHIDTGSDASMPDGGLGIDTSNLTPLVPTFSLDGADFLSTPWPSDHRLRPDGTPDLSTFPDATVGLTPTFIDAIHGVVDGYSIMPAIYVNFASELSDVSVPTPSETLAPDSPVQLINLSEEACGTRVPLVVEIDVVGDRFRPANTLTARPVAGFVLDASAAYGLVVQRTFGAATDQFVDTPAPLMRALQDAASDPLEEALRTSLDPWLRCAPLPTNDIGVVTVFTTQDPVGELQTIRDFTVDPVQTPAPVVAALEESDAFAEHGYRAWTAHYETPIFQRGTSPYTDEGGFVMVDGVPEIQRWEEVPMLITVPEAFDAPYPLLVFMPGTGGNLGPTPFQRTARQAMDQGFAVATFSPQFHGTRAVPNSDPVLHGFNYLNPVSGRTVFRQQAIDTSYFVRVLREGLVDTEVAALLDTDHLIYGGHSQGGLVGTLVAGTESEFDAYVFNGTGSYMSVTVTQRTDPIDIPQLIEDLFRVGRAVDLTHPIIALVQLGTDVVDPQSYAPRWRGGAHNPSGAHVFVVNGYNDTTTFPLSMAAMTISGDLDVVAPAGWDVDPFEVWPRLADGMARIRGNRLAVDGTPLTMASFLDRDGDHFTFSRNDRARDLAVDFWLGARDNGLPTVE